MGRVTPQGDGGPATAGGQRHREQIRDAANLAKPSYKVVIEEVVQQKKKLITLQSAQQKPPPGYTFVAAGNPELTSACKELSRRDGASIYVVSTTKHKTTALSNQVHRIGFHFPTSIVSRACTSLGIDLSNQNQILRMHEEWPVENHKLIGKKKKSRLSKAAALAAAATTQEQVDREAEKAIKDLFPAIPDADLASIIHHAFELGTKRVGARLDELSLPRRVQLAVVAHIRHAYTEYDKLLKEVPYLMARQQVEPVTLEKMAEWRGENETDVEDMEEILREVIVISEDEDDGEPETPMVQRLEEYHGSPGSDVQELTDLGNGQYVISRRERAGAQRREAWYEARRRIQRPPKLAAKRGRDLRERSPARRWEEPQYGRERRRDGYPVGGPKRPDVEEQRRPEARSHRLIPHVDLRPVSAAPAYPTGGYSHSHRPLEPERDVMPSIEPATPRHLAAAPTHEMIIVDSPPNRMLMDPARDKRNGHFVPANAWPGPAADVQLRQEARFVQEQPVRPHPQALFHEPRLRLTAVQPRESPIPVNNFTAPRTHSNRMIPEAPALNMYEPPTRHAHQVMPQPNGYARVERPVQSVWIGEPRPPPLLQPSYESRPWTGGPARPPWPESQPAPFGASALTVEDRRLPDRRAESTINSGDIVEENGRLFDRKTGRELVRIAY